MRLGSDLQGITYRDLGKADTEIGPWRVKKRLLDVERKEIPL